MATIYKIFCLLVGETKPISIKIESNATVSEVADQVWSRENRKVGKFNLSSLKLYRVDATDVDKAKEKMNQIKLDEDELGFMEELNTIYQSGPPRNTIHFIVVLPSNGESVKSTAPVCRVALRRCGAG
jgi:hypothetical protein